MSKYASQKSETRKRMKERTPEMRVQARFNGEKQFGENAKPYHIEQRNLGLATARTPAVVAAERVIDQPKTKKEIKKARRAEIAQIERNKKPARRFKKGVK